MWRGAPSWTSLFATAAGASFLLRHYNYVNGFSFTSLFLAFSFLFIFLRLFWTVYVWPRHVSKLLWIPQPADNVTFWSSIALVPDEEVGHTHREWINSVPNDGMIRYHVLGGGERIFLTSPKAISEAFVARPYDYRRPPIAHEILSRVLGVGLLLAEGDEHRVQRKNLTPAFSVPHVKALVPTFYSFAARLVKGITEENRQKGGEWVEVPFDVWVSRATLDIIGAAGMGVDFGALEDPENVLSVAYREVFDLTIQEQLLQLSSLVISFRWLQYLPLKRNRQVKNGIATIRATARAMIESKQRQLEKKETSEHKDILSIALESGHFTVDNLVNQVMTFLAAGHETTSTATQWAMIVLTTRTEMQEKLRSEIREHLPSIEESSHITSEQLDRLVYLKAFCSEVLRFHPPVTFTARVAHTDTQILGHHIPKGSDIVVVPAAMNFSKELWGEDAYDFRPERWLEPGCANSGGAESPYANMTFTTGVRGCIGAAFAKHELQCIVAAIIGRFEVKLDPDFVLITETSVVTRPKGGLPLQMKVIGGW